MVSSNADERFSDEAGLFLNLKRFSEIKALRHGESKLPSYNEIEKNHPNIIDKNPEKRIFITHRWDDVDHPDPTRWQLQTLIAMADHYHFRGQNYSFWYDYMSLPQKPRNSDQERIFSAGLNSIRSIISSCHQKVSLISFSKQNSLFDPSREYIDLDKENFLKRGWIIFEVFLAERLRQGILPMYESIPLSERIQESRYRQMNEFRDLNIYSRVPINSADTVYNWFIRNGISCTNGSDLAYLSRLLFEELTQFDLLSPPPGIEFGVPVDMTWGELARYQVTHSDISSRFPNIFMKKCEISPENADLVRVTMVYRPRLPPLESWSTESEVDRVARQIDMKTMTSLLYPGIRFEYSRNMDKVRVFVA